MKPLGPGDPLRLGPYRLIGVLGAGGMGQVYLGRDGSGRTAAVKVLHTEIAHDQEMARRFVREAQTAQSVRSKGVARVLAAHTEGGRPWIATEFLAGPTLDEAVEKYGPFGDSGFRALAALLARTLQDIHETGLVHRDLKPPNIVLTSDGPRIIDFGIARPEHGLTLTSTGQVPVTPGYGAPEQVLGHRTGPPADVFSLGAVLAYAASGRRTFEGGHVAAVQYEVVHGEPDLTGLGPELRALIEPCLAKDAAMRPLPGQIEGAMTPPRRADRAWREGQLAEDIAQREADAKRLAEFPGDDTGVPQRTRRRAIALMATGGAAVAALGAGAWWKFGSDESGSRSWTADLLPASAADEGRAPQPLWGPVADAAHADSPVPVPVRDLVVVGGADGGLAAYGVEDGKLRWTYGDALRLAGFLAPTDDLMLGVDDRERLVGLGTQDGKPLWRASVGATALLATDGEAVYFLTGGSRVRAVALDSGEELWTVAAPVATSLKSSRARAVAGDGRLVLFGTGGAVGALDARTGESAWPVRKGQAGQALTPALAEGVVYLGGKSLTAVDVRDGSTKWSHRSESLGDGESDGWTAPAVSGDVLYAADGTALKQRRLSDGTQTWTYGLGYGVPPLDPPVVQADTVWIGLDRTGAAGVATVRAGNGSRAWRYGAGRGGTRHMAAAGNRVFLLHNGSLTAMPVF